MCHDSRLALFLGLACAMVACGSDPGGAADGVVTDVVADTAEVDVTNADAAETDGADSAVVELDTATADTVTPDTVPAVDAAEDTELDTYVPCTATVAIASPLDDEIVYTGQDVAVSATVTAPDGAAPTDFVVRWTNGAGQLLGTSAVTEQGDTTAELTGLGGGTQTIFATAFDAAGACAATATVGIVGCGQQISETFTDDPHDSGLWVFTGDAAWVSVGWIELTGPYQDHIGGVYTNQQPFAAGSASVRYRIYTGGGSDPGADGFAISFIAAVNAAAIDSIVAAAQGSTGGGLGYGLGGNYGAFAGEAFTVEIDTWYNQYNGTTELHTDPTPAAHLEVTRGLDPGNSVAYAEVPGISGAWHDVRVDVITGTIRVWLDGDLLIDVTVPGFKFPGGYVLLSSSTGYYYNLHRFDDLQILHGCEAAPSQ